MKAVDSYQDCYNVVIDCWALNEACLLCAQPIVSTGCFFCTSHITSEMTIPKVCKVQETIWEVQEIILP